MPLDYTNLIKFGLEYNKDLNKNLSAVVELDCNVGFTPIVGTFIEIKEKIDNQEPNYSFINITTNSTYQALRLGLQYRFY